MTTDREALVECIGALRLAAETALPYLLEVLPTGEPAARDRADAHRILSAALAVVEAEQGGRETNGG